MQIKITYMAQIKTITDKSSETISVPDDCRAQDLIAQLCGSYGDHLKQVLLDDSGRLRRVILLFINEEQVRWEDNPPLSENADVCFMSPIAGGN